MAREEKRVAIKRSRKPKRFYLTQRLETDPFLEVSFGGMTARLSLPDGCVGISLAFVSKKAARAYYGKKIKFLSSPLYLKEKE